MNRKIELDTAAAPDEIEARSFEIIEDELRPPRRFRGLLWEVARRCVHASGDPSILPWLVLSEEGLQAGLAAMRAGCVIYADTRMLAAGLVKRRMDPLGIEVRTLMDAPGVERLARESGQTRARAGARLVAPMLGGQIMAVGNAPTALLEILEAIRENPAPALIVGMPVGFVNAAQSKELLVASGRPCFSLLGRKGGAAITAACLNALAEIVLREKREGKV